MILFFINQEPHFCNNVYSLNLTLHIHSTLIVLQAWTRHGRGLSGTYSRLRSQLIQGIDVLIYPVTRQQTCKITWIKSLDILSKWNVVFFFSMIGNIAFSFSLLFTGTLTIRFTVHQKYSLNQVIDVACGTGDAQTLCVTRENL